MWPTAYNRGIAESELSRTAAQQRRRRGNCVRGLVVEWVGVGELVLLPDASGAAVPAVGGPSVLFPGAPAGHGRTDAVGG